MYELLGYPSTWTAEPGETVDFQVSCEGVKNYTVDIVRVRSGDDSPGAPGLKETVYARDVAGSVPGRKQETYPGSYALVAPFMESAEATRSWVLGLMPTLTRKGSWQTVFGRWDAQKRIGYRLALDPAGCLSWQQGNGLNVETTSLPLPMVDRQWYLVAVVVDCGTGTVRLSQRPVSPLHALNSGCQVEGRLSTERSEAVNELPFVMGANLHKRGRQTEVLDAFNGRIDSLSLLRFPASEQDVQQLLSPPSSRRFAAPAAMAWDFAHGIDSDQIHDAACPSRLGELFNLPARAVPGLRWDASVNRWTEQADHFAALHFHDDALADAQWATDFSYRLPDDMPSGLYAARLTAGDKVERVTFIVHPKRGASRKKIAFLASTATYMAYSNSHYRLDEEGMEMKAGNFAVVQPWEQYLGEHRELGLSMYDTHSDGYGVYYASRLRPVFSMRLQERTWSLNADTHLLDWMEEKRFDFDVISDDMLHRDGLQALEGYNVVVTGAHPEYWTTRMWDAMTAYQNQGGRLMYMGGNGFYWRCAYHPTKPWLMELRRTETGARYWETPAGEGYHSFGGEYGGTWRRIGKAPQTLVGVGTAATGFDASSYYRRRPESRDARAAFIFEGVPEEIIGNFGSSGGGAAGDEIDRADVLLGTPPHALVLARSEGHTRYYNLAPEETTYHHPTINGQEAKNCHADLVFYECLNGGAVFATGSITWGASLAWENYTNNVSKITENVLRRFASDTPFEFPSGS